VAAFEKIFDRITNIVETIVFIISSILIMGVSLLICVEMIMRNLGHSLIMVEELSLIGLGWISFFAGAYCFRKKGHVLVDFIYAKFPQKVKVALYTITYMVGIIFMVRIAFESRLFAIMQMRTPLIQSRLPRGLISMGLPVGSCFIIFFLITDLIETLILKRRRSLMSQEELQNMAIEEAAKEMGDYKDYLTEEEKNTQEDVK
jgi:TRAP-type C4-dicarboxylate transport system permease small subunit